MFFLYNVSLSALFIVLLSAIYFLGEKIKSAVVVINSRISSSLIEIIEAVLFGLFFVGLQIIFNDMKLHFIVNLFIVVFLVLFFIKGILFSSIVMAPGLLHFLITKNFDDSFYLIIAATFLTAIVFELTNFFLDSKKTKAITYIFLLAISSLFFIVSAYAMKEGATNQTFLDDMMPFLIVIFVDFFFSYLIKFSLSANILYESINFVFSTYYRDSLLFGVMANEIKNKKIAKGIFGVFDIKYIDVDTEEDLKELKEKVLLEVKNKFPDRTLLFKFNDRKYAFFISTVELNGNVNIKYKVEINKIEESMKQINKKYILENSKQYSSWINTGISIYGKQTSSIKELEIYAQYVLDRTYFGKNTFLKIFNYLEYRNNVKDVVLVQQLDDAVGLDNYLLKFMPIIDIETKKTKYMFSEPENISETQYIGDIRTYMESIDKLEIFERYYATEAIKSFKENHGKFLIHFSAARMSVKNYSYILINSFKLKEIDMKNIILIIRTNEIKDQKEFMKNIYTLKTEGISFATYFENGSKIIEKTKFKTDILLINDLDKIDKKIINKMETGKIKLINVGVKNDDEILLSKKIGIRYIGGSGLQSNLFPKILDKQSKIYLNKIFKRRKT